MREAGAANQCWCARAVATEASAGGDEELADTPRHDAVVRDRSGGVTVRQAHRRHAGEVLSMEGGQSARRPGIEEHGCSVPRPLD